MKCCMLVNLVFKVDVEHATEKAMAVPSVCVFVCVSVGFINRLTSAWTWPFSVKTCLCSSPSSVVFIHPYFSQRLSCVPLLSMPTSSPRRCGFLRLMRVGCFLPPAVVCVCVWCRTRPCWGLLLIIRLELGWGLLSWSPLALCYQLERLCDELQSGGFLGGEPEQSSAGERRAWPVLLRLDNKQTQQFSRGESCERREGCESLGGRTLNLLVIIISDECAPMNVFCVCMCLKCDSKLRRNKVSISKHTIN